MKWERIGRSGLYPTQDPADHEALASRSDEELLSGFREHRDEGAFAELVERYQRPIRRYLVRYLGKADLADEATQTTMLALFEKAWSFAEGRRVRPWLYSIATHEAVNLLRREGRQPALHLDSDQQDGDELDVGPIRELLEAHVASPFEQAAADERRDWVHRAVDELPDKLLVTILLIYFEGLTFEETADTLGLPIGTVKSRVHKALGLLHEAWIRDHPHLVSQEA